MRRDRDGSELVDVNPDIDVDQVLHDARCHDGWLGTDEDHPIPCPVCKPHLERGRRRTHIQLHGPWAAA